MLDSQTIDNETFLGEICILLSEGKSVKLRAKGNSMRPFIYGSTDTLLLVPPCRPRKGDVVLARIDGKRYVVHRIIGMKGDRITLMGDGNLRETEQCYRSDIHAIVESVIRDSKAYELRSPTARFNAMAWRCLLPLRRLKVKISNKIVRK